MKKTLAFVCLVLVLQNLFAQKDVSEKYANIITTDLLKKHLTIIASAEMEGRETGTIGQRKAAAYIEAQFKAIGLKAPVALNGSYQQLYPLNQDSMDVTASLVKIDTTQLVYGKDYFVAAMNNSNKNVDGSQFVFVGYGISDDKYDDYKNLDVTGKIVVMLLGEPKADGKYLLTGTAKYSKFTYPGISVKMQMAAQKGAIAAIVINPAMPVLNDKVVSSNSKSNVYYPSSKGEKANYFVASHETAKRFFPQWPIDSLIKAGKQSAIFETAKYEQVKASFNFQFKKEKQVINASNVIGVVEGTDKKEEYVFVTGHYDHLGIRGDKIYYGADDDGSGTCGVMAMAEAFAKAKAAGKGPRRTMIFMTVSGEEKGLWGSQYYSENPVFPLDKTSVDLNIDMVGRLDTERKLDDTLNYVYVIGHNKLSSDLPVINEAANNKYTKLVLDYKYDDPEDVNRIYYRSDHYNFARKGVPILFFYDGMLKADYHKPTDTIEKINWDLYQKRVKMIFFTAWEIANRNEMLKRDIPLVEGER
jgi:hypothetical protein